jgi:hypothetical protein
LSKKSGSTTLFYSILATGIKLHAARLDIRKNSLAVRTVQKWNELPSYIKSAKTHTHSREILKNGANTVGGLNTGNQQLISTVMTNHEGVLVTPKRLYTGGDGG